jgi:periplasmic divalent cation tolerance protein
MEILLVLCNAPDAKCASALADRLVGSGAAACVNIGPPVGSIYRWQGGVERTLEFPLAIKTTRGSYADVEREILTHHPYEVPEIIAIRVDQGLPAYLAWVSETDPTS